MKSNKDSLNQENFEMLLSLLDPDREIAGQKYEIIRKKLIDIFDARGCLVSEELADETIDRVINVIKVHGDNYINDIELYFYGVGKNVLYEYYKKPKSEKLDPLMIQKEKEIKEPTLIQKCLRACLMELTPEERRLIIGYYQKDKQAKIENRKTLAQEAGGSNELLRTRLFRIRKKLQKCIKKCLE